MNPILRHSNKIHDFHKALKKSYAILTSKKAFDSINLSQQKVIKITPESIQTPLRLEGDWELPSRIDVIPMEKISSTLDGNTHYYFGGLPALMQAVRKLEALKKNNRSDQVIYVTDGKITKSDQSGHQGHVHPSEWSAEDCQTWNLFKTFFKGMGVIKEDDPADLKHYSYLHFPIYFRDILKHPIKHLGMYSKFFKQRMIHTLTSKNGVSKQDQWLCECVRKSLTYHEELSKKVGSITGFPTFKRGFRVYWSPDLKAIEKKKKMWETLGVKVEFMKLDEINQFTLTRYDHLKENLYILKIYDDGKFYPQTIDRITLYLKSVYPNFKRRLALVDKIFVDTITGKPFRVREEDPTSQKQTCTEVSSVFGSPGHNEVYRLDPVKRKFVQMWNEVPVSGISSVWSCKISLEKLSSRMNPTYFSRDDFRNTLTDNEIESGVKNLVAMANLSNLHVTVWDCQIKDRTIELIVRATQGANFNSTVASKSDLWNMRNNLERYFVGDWTLLSVGTCTRKTDVSNVPEFVKLSEDSGLLHGMSGIGYSFSATPFEDLSYKSTDSQKG